MYFMNKIILLISVSIVSSELPVTYSSFNGFQKFRPSQNLDSLSGTYEYTQYNPNDFILSLKQPNRNYGVPPHHNHQHPSELPNGHHVPEHPPPNFYNAPHIPNFNKPHQSYFNIPDLKPPHFQQKPLFTPAAGGFDDFPASQGQVDNYNKAVQEEVQQQLQQDDDRNTAFANGFTGYSNMGHHEHGHHQAQPAKSYVNVKLGPQNLQYQYQF